VAQETKRIRRTRGRPRDEAVDRRVLSATMDLLSEVGLHGLTIESVAARARVGRPALYRRWRSRDEVVVAALISTVRPLVDADTGDTRRDLLRMVQGLVHDLDAHRGRGVLGVHASIRPGTPLARALRERYLGPREVSLSAVLQRGLQRGTIRGDLEPEVVRDLLFGPPIYHLLITGAPMGEQLLEAAYGAVWEAIAAPPSRGRSGRPRATARRSRSTVVR
jgi:AcrR family transcriptional regulator